MEIEKITKNNVEIAHVTGSGILISDVQTALDLMMSVKYDAGVKNVVISKNLITDKFFILSSGVAGEILQKFINYEFRIAIYGDFSKYNSKPLKDFIYESNNGRDVFFCETFEKAVEKLAGV